MIAWLFDRLDLGRLWLIPIAEGRTQKERDR